MVTTVVCSILALFLVLLLVKINKVYKEIFKKSLSVNHAMVHYNYDVDYFHESPDHYYADFTRSVMNKKHYVTEDGIFQLGGDSLESSVINICGVCEFALINYDKFLQTKNQENLNHFKKNLEWLVDNAVPKNEMIFWYYDMDGPKPWASSISQGMAISVLIRGYIYTKDVAYLNLAKRAFKTLSSSIHEGGFKYSYDHFDCWFEESSDNSHILNGHIYALMGIYDLYRCTKDEDVLLIFNQGCNNIKTNIAYFDLSFISTYDAVERFPSNNSYHMIHIVLFEVLGEITKDIFFKTTATKWRKIYGSKKLRFYGFIYTFNLLINLKVTGKWK